MSDDGDTSVKLISSNERNMKNPALGKGKPVPEIENIIPFETPGREVAIRPRSPFKEALPINDDLEDNIRTIDQINGIPLSIARSSPGSSRLSNEDRKNNLRGRGVYEKPPSPVNEKMMFPNNYPYPQMFSSGTNNFYQHPNSYHPNNFPPNYYHYTNQQMPPQNYMNQQIPDYDNMPKSEQEDARIIFKSKFNKLKEKYPERKFDDYDPDLPLRHIHRIYEDHLNNISAESNFSMSRIFLTVIFFCIEGFFTKFIGIDIGGFANDQLKQLKRYESLLMELGEKYTSGFGSNWPIEFRIIFLIGFNTLSVAGIKFLCNKAGYSSDYATKIFNNLVGSTVDEFVEKKIPPPVDPVTKTVDPDTDDTTNNLMGKAQELANMASSIFGGPKSKDPAEMVSHWGNKALSSLPGKSGENDKQNKRSINNIKYGRNKRR